MVNQTTERLFQKYNTYTRRPTIRDERVKGKVFRAFRRTLGPWLPPDRSARILDVGCGEGALLCFLKSIGYQNLEGFDISPENVSICRELGLAFVEQFNALDLADWKGKDYDVIFVMDLLEHLPKALVGGFLEVARAKLRPGGYLVIQTPNMGSVLGLYHRYSDLSHEFGLTEKSAVDLLLVAGFSEADIEIRASWNATTVLGYMRELYLRLLHHAVFLAEGRDRPKIPAKNLLIRAKRS